MGDSMELKYCLRSVDQFMPDIEDVYLVGNDKPTWYFGSTIPCAQEQRLPGVCNVMKKLKTACEDPRVTEIFWYGNDDVYLLEPAKDGPFFMANSPIRNDGSVHHKGFQLTFTELDRRGINHPKDAELHYPVVYEKSRVLKLMSEIDIRLPYSFRTLYFNLLGVQLAPANDHKRFSWIQPKPNDYCVSSNDNTVGQQVFIEWARKTFPRKSRWEA